MAETSSIEWTDSTWNVITGCTLVSEGCRHCYAATLAAGRLQNHPSRKGLARVNAAGEAKFTGEVRFNEEWLDQPLRWRRPRMIFVCAHGDLFHESVPDEWIDRVFAVMALAPQHVFQILSKRPERARAYLNDPKAVARIATLVAWPLPNVWLGTSVEDQAAADERIPHLLATPAAVRFLSAEPLLGPVDVEPWLHDSYCYLFRGVRGRDNVCACSASREVVDWVIVGGESGRDARPMHSDWARTLRDQCAAAGVPFFFKQWGSWAPGLINRRGVSYGCFDDAGRWVQPAQSAWAQQGRQIMSHVGKAAAGRLLDGVEHNGMPEGRS